MTYGEEKIRRQLSLGEDSHWEFNQAEFAGSRPSSPRRDELADEIAAFANADGGAPLCGVTERGDAQGLAREQMDELERRLLDICTDAIKPPVRPTILRRIIDQRPLRLIEGPQGHVQHDGPGRQLPPGRQFNAPDDKRRGRSSHHPEENLGIQRLLPQV